MRKKFHWEKFNSKAVGAKARKARKVASDQAKKEKAAEDEFWRDDDKHVNKKLQRKVKIHKMNEWVINNWLFIHSQEEKEKKKQEDLERKKQNKQLEEIESTQLKNQYSPNQPAKVTAFQIQVW